MRSIKVLVQKHSLFIEQAIRTRLSNEGTYADGKKIKTYAATGSLVYSPFTISSKGAEGKRTDIVTLEDTGELHSSFVNKAKGSEFVTNYNDRKEDGNVSDNIPELDEAIKLGNKGMTELKELIKIDLRHDYKEEAKQAIYNGFK